MSSQMTLPRYILANHPPNVASDLMCLMGGIESASKIISNGIRNAGLNGLYGLEGGAVNASGQRITKLDAFSHNAMVSAIVSSTKGCLLVSEEAPDCIVVDEAVRGQYCVVFDPLDGSSNIDCNVSVGSIFGIYARKSAAAEGAPTVADALQPGRNLVASGYTIYGSSTQMVLTFGNGVNIFTHDQGIGEFVLTRPNVRIPAHPNTIYSINEGNSRYWEPAVANFVAKVKHAKVPYSGRYVGSMVADIHRTLLYGGIFLYPGDKKSPSGKLRLLYECNPMAFIVEQAGGKATTGVQRMLDVQPTSIHEKQPIFIGCNRDVEMLEAEITAAAAAAEGIFQLEGATGGPPLITGERAVWISEEPEQFVHSEDMVHWQQYMFNRSGEEL